MEVTWLGQAGFLLDGGVSRCLFDPFLTVKPSRLVDPPVDPQALPDVAAVFVSHEHPDHFDPPPLRRLTDAQSGVRIVLPAPILPLAIEVGLPPEQLLGAVPGGWTHVDGIRFHPIPAMHGVTMEDAYTFGPDGPSRPRFLGYVVEIGGRRVYHAGDTLAWDGLADELRGLDVENAFLPINGRDVEREAQGIVGNMDAREAVVLAAAAGCRVLVPMHFGMFASNNVDPAFVDREVAAGPTALVVSRPVLGVSIAV